MVTEEQEKELKKNQVFQWIAVVGIIIKDDKILLGKRLKETDYGQFEPPGGKIELGEDLEDALVREVKEETGIEVKPLNLIGHEGQPIFIGQSDKRSVVNIYFLTEIVDDKGKLDNTNELAEIEFYSKEEVKKFLEQNLCRNCERTILEKFVKGELE